MLGRRGFLALLAGGFAAAALGTQAAEARPAHVEGAPVGPKVAKDVAETVAGEPTEMQRVWVVRRRRRVFVVRRRRVFVRRRRVIIVRRRRWRRW